MFESSFLGGKFDLLQEIRECGVEAMEGALGSGRSRGRQRTGGPKRPRVDARVEHRDLGAGLRDAIAMAARHAFDETVQPESAEVVGHGSGRIGLGVSPLELRDVIAELPMAEPGGGEREETECVHEGVGAGVAEPEAGGALVRDLDG